MLRGSQLYYAMAMFGLTLVAFGIGAFINTSGITIYGMLSVLGLALYLFMLQRVLRFKDLDATQGISHYIAILLIFGIVVVFSLSLYIMLLLCAMVLALHFGFRRYNNKWAQVAHSGVISEIPQETSQTVVPIKADVIEKKAKRKGWQLPGRSIQLNAAQLASDRSDTGSAPANDHRRYATMKGSVFGQVRTKDLGSLSTDTFVTLRLERNDPHAGLSFVVSLRLEGGDAVGFAEVGDWVEATGIKKSAYLMCSRCLNHTTGSVFDNRLDQSKKKLGYLFKGVFVLFWIACAYFIIGLGMTMPSMQSMPLVNSVPSDPW